MKLFATWRKSQSRRHFFLQDWQIYMLRISRWRKYFWRRCLIVGMQTITNDIRLKGTLIQIIQDLVYSCYAKENFGPLLNFCSYIRNRKPSGTSITVSYKPNSFLHHPYENLQRAFCELHSAWYLNISQTVALRQVRCRPYFIEVIF